MCDEDDIPDFIECPACGNDEENALLGQLGRRCHFRCRACGITFSILNPHLCEDCADAGYSACEHPNQEQ